MTKRKIPTGPEPVYDRVVSGYEIFHSAQPFTCEWGGVLPEITLAYETRLRDLG
jgi:homoserine O-acetyltransferase